jgi:hypothetical protein
VTKAVQLSSLRAEDNQLILKQRSSSLLLKPLAEVVQQSANNKTSEWPSQSTFQAPHTKTSHDDETMKKLITEILESKLQELKALP